MRISRVMAEHAPYRRRWRFTAASKLRGMSHCFTLCRACAHVSTLSSHIVHDIMHRHDPEGFARREPTAKRIQRSQKHPLGIHERWAGDGHDKLYSINFPVWAVVDDATTKGLGAWVVPSNRIGIIIAYLFLTLVVVYGGAASNLLSRVSYSSPFCSPSPPIYDRLWFRNYTTLWTYDCAQVFTEVPQHPSPRALISCLIFAERYSSLSMT